MSGTAAGFDFARAPDIEAELDRMAGEMMATLTQPEETLDLDGRRALLVDDVVYTGRTFARALDYVTGLGAAEVRCAALCVRRGRELPVRPAVVGFRCDVGGGSIVDVRIPPYEDRLAIELRRKDRDGE